ncbi:replication protein A 32 kDa subunit-like [Pholidichthys leucotaenia]
MWNQGCCQSTSVCPGSRSVQLKRAGLHVLPCTVSQLLAAPQVCNDMFVICDHELNQVSILGAVKGFAQFVTTNQYAVDDMTGAPMNVVQWVDTEMHDPATSASPGTYVKVIGSLRNFSGQRSLMAMSIRCITDPNEITSHMLEVVQAHMQLGKVMSDANILDLTNLKTVFENPSIFYSLSRGEGHGGSIPSRVAQSATQFIQHHDLSCRTSLAFLINEGHILTTIDEHHFRSLRHSQFPESW